MVSQRRFITRHRKSVFTHRPPASTHGSGPVPSWGAAAAIAALLLTLGPARAQVHWIDKFVLTGDGAGHAMVYDEVRERIVLFGGGAGLTWEWDGVCWTRHDSRTRPTPRSGFTMAYDKARRLVVLFGGRSSSTGGLMSDTWEWDGFEWSYRTSFNVPPARQHSSMAYDALRQRTVLFGGTDTTTRVVMADTWEWDGVNWQRLLPAVSPAGRLSHAMAYDAARQRVVLFGGGSGGTSFTGTWEWDGTIWTAAQPSTQPPERFSHTLAYDAARQRVVLFGGIGSSRTALADTWEWDGTNWSARSSATRPTVRYGHAMAFDAARRVVVVFGGKVSPGLPFELYLSDTWAWDGSSWGLLAPEVGPTHRSGAAMVYDAARARAVVFGGVTGLSGLGETWEWQAHRWTRRFPPASPSPRTEHGMAYDGARQHTVLFGGRLVLPSLIFGDTWEWDGTSWAQLSPSTAPSARSGHAMVYDARRQRVVLFGGATSLLPRIDLADTWEWDGTNWTELFPATSPPARSAHAMAYDAARERVILFGGLPASSDTWEWDGMRWTQRFPSISPPARSSPAMAYDAARSTTVLLGGAGSVGNPLSDTWEWDGTTWRQLLLPVSPVKQSGHAMAYDGAAQQVVLLGGRGGTDTWILGARPPASTQEYGRGCSGGQRVPSLSGYGRPALGNACFGLDLVSLPPGARVAALLSLNRASLSLGACTLLVDPAGAVVLPGTANSSGFASIGVSVPRIPALVGSSIHTQGVVFDPAGAFLSLAFTNGLTLRIGE